MFFPILLLLLREVLMLAYSQDLRDRVLRALDRGDRPSEIARRFEVSRMWVYQVRDRLQETGQRGSFQIGGHRRSQLEEFETTLRSWTSLELGLTLSERHERLVQQGVSIKNGALWLQSKRWTLRFSKISARERTSSGGRA